MTHRPGTPLEMADDIRKAIKDRMLAILFSQSFDIIDRNIGTKQDLNLGCKIALGFKNGPLDIMRAIGVSEVSRIMDDFEKNRPGFPKPVKPIQAYQDFNRFILIDQIEGVMIITIRRPESLNALNDDVTNEILAVLKEYANDPSVKGFVITGYGNTAFSAGADIGKFPEMLGDRSASIQYAKDCAKLQRFIDHMKKPVIAAINGLALGGGLEVAIRCHGMVAVKNALFRFPEITLGILPGIGGCVVPYRKWPKGTDTFNEMICLGKPLTAVEALDIGMVSKLADNYRDMIDDAIGEVADLQENINQIPDGPIDIPEIVIPEGDDSPAATLSKEAILITVDTIKKCAAAGNFDEALEAGYNGFGETACLEAAKEGITAFLEKRKPVFKK